MVQAYETKYEITQSNAEIPASSSAVYGQSTADREAKTKYGSFNEFTINSLSGNEFNVLLDGIDIYAKFSGTGIITLKAERGRYFDFIKITNLDGVNVITAADLSITMKIQKEKV